MERIVLSLLVENNPGVASRISGLFSRRSYNMESLSSGVTADPRFERVTIVVNGDQHDIEQIEKQLAKLEDVRDIKILKPGSSVTRELMLIKIRAPVRDECDGDFPWQNCGCFQGFHGDRAYRQAG